jgi:hypothetical protein
MPQGRSEGRGGYGAEGGEIVLFQYRRGVGILIAKQETAVRPERPGLKVAEIQAEAGDSVTAGQILARLTLPEGGSVQARSQNQIGDARNSANPALSLQVRIRGA